VPTPAAGVQSTENEGEASFGQTKKNSKFKAVAMIKKRLRDGPRALPSMLNRILHCFGLHADLAIPKSFSRPLSFSQLDEGDESKTPTQVLIALHSRLVALGETAQRMI
jgi:hypothetical protein